MSHIFPCALFAAGLFSVILLMIQAGRYIRGRQSASGIEPNRAGLAAIEGALFALLGLILAFSFSGALSRFDARRQLIVNEANCIGTAYLRLELLAPPARQDLQAKFRQYLNTRLEAYRALPDIAKAEAGIARAAAIQGEIWTMAITAAGQQGSAPQATMLILPALNAMFDIANTRYLATRMHPPLAIFLLMGVLVMICSLLAGYGMGDGKARNWIHVISFSALLAITIYTIVDLELPRLGLIQVTDFDRALVDVRNNMGESRGTHERK